jgi:hypothetical protein
MSLACVPYFIESPWDSGLSHHVTQGPGSDAPGLKWEESLVPIAWSSPSLSPTERYISRPPSTAAWEAPPDHSLTNASSHPPTHPHPS